MKKMILVEEEELNKELERIEMFGARQALNHAEFILRHDINQKEIDEYAFNSKYFGYRQSVGDQRIGNPQLTILGISRFYRLIVARAEKEHPEFFKSIIEQIKKEK